MIYAIYIASVCGALAVYLMLPHKRSMAKLGGILAVSTLAFGLGWLVNAYGPDNRPHLPGVYYYIFTFIALASAARVVTHPRPVYAALYFVLVVLSTSGMLVLLSAEFMAFAMVIIYAGAILVTYMFVIMLATEPQSSREDETSPVYDREAREPFLAVLMGFTLLAVIGGIVFGSPAEPLPRDYAVSHLATLGEMQKRVDLSDVNQARRLQATLRDLEVIGLGEKVYAVDFEAGTLDVREAEGVAPRVVDLKASGMRDKVLDALIPNTDQVGMNLFKGHTLGIELAAVILLLSMVGAIVIARRMVPEMEPEHKH